MKPRASDIVRALECANDTLKQRADRADLRNRDLQKRVTDLEAEVVALKPQIGLPPIVQAPFHLGKTENAIFTLLMARDVVSEEMINTRLYSSRPDGGPASKTAQTYICNLRRKIAKHGFQVVNDRGVGWFIPQDDKTRIRQVLSKGGMPHAATPALTPASPRTLAPHAPERRHTATPR